MEKDLRMTLAAVHTPKAEAVPAAVEELAVEGAEGASVAEPGVKEEKKEEKPEKESKKKE
jgi:hypothetical protein